MEELKVLALDVAEHLLDVVLTRVVEDLAIAKAANGPLWVCVNTEHRQGLVLDETSSFQERSVTAYRDHDVRDERVTYLTIQQGRDPCL